MGGALLLFRPMSSPLLLGHRGAPLDAPENTLPSLREALAQGADGCEFDLRLTLDGVPVLSHDATLERCAGVPVAVGRVSLRALQRYRLYGDARVPTLEEALELLRGRFANLELKCDTPAEAEPLAHAVTAALRRARTPLDSVVLSSFEPLALFHLRALDARLPLGVLFEPDPLSSARALRLGASLPSAALHPCFVQCTPEALARWRTLGRRVNVWTVDDGTTARRLARDGASVLITNRPAFLRAELSLNGA